MGATKLKLKGKELSFECSSGIRNNDKGDFLDTESLELTPESMADMSLCKLAYMLENGYQSCYKDIGDYMIDWSMDLPWDNAGREASKKHMKDHPTWKYVYSEFNKQYPDCQII